MSNQNQTDPIEGRSLSQLFQELEDAAIALKVFDQKIQALQNTADEITRLTEQYVGLPTRIEMLERRVNALEPVGELFERLIRVEKKTGLAK